MSMQETVINTNMSNAYSMVGSDLSCSLSDGTANATDAGQRRILACSPFLNDTDIAICIAAWHGVLHWLRYNDEPVVTCLLGQHAEKCWPIVTSVTENTSLGELLAEVKRQWTENEGDWFHLHDPNHPHLADQLRCHAIYLQGTSATETEFAIVRNGETWLVDCDASRFSESYQRVVMTMWAKIAGNMLDNPALPLSENEKIEILSRQQLAQTILSGPAIHITGNLLQRFSARALAHADKTAILDEDGPISYSELHALSEQWAQSLHAVGVGRGDHIGVAFGRNRRMIAAQLAVLKVGGVFIPMDATQPANRLQAMADDAEMRMTLSEDEWAPLMRSALAEIPCLDATSLTVHASTNHQLSHEHALEADDLAYVIFTSGSTGRPKGVKVSHGNLLNFVSHLGELLNSDDIVSQFAPATFDASVGEIYSSLLNGVTLIILPGALIDNPDQLQAYMREKQVTFSCFPPQYAKHLAPENLPQLRVLLTAGSAPDHELVRRWQPHLKYVNAYGPTETTILSTLWQANYLPEQHEQLPIGLPITNTEIRIVNRFNQTLPIGATGELLIGGAGVAQGYLKRDEMTREKFITMDQIRWYRSGDLSCLDSENRLFFAGRVDNQIKLRGRRLEPGEVETALLTLSSVEHAAVIAVDVQSSKQLIAFCVGQQQADEAIRDGLKQVLPEWALPNRILWLSKLPLTANGKTDYRALQTRLQQTEAEAPEKPSDYVDELEAQIADIWRSVLQQPNISRDDNFIHLGGDSLTSLVVMSALKRLGYHITSSQLLLHPRLADFAEVLRHSARSLVRDYTSHQGSAPLSPIQGWFFHLQLEQPGLLCQTLSFETSEKLDVDRLHGAFTQLVTYHDQLRARFVHIELGDAKSLSWRQEIDGTTLTLPPIQCTDVADTDLDKASELIRDKLAAELNVEQAPLFRIALLKTPNRSRVVWVLHHLLVDTISHGILLDDLHHLYISNESEIEAILPGKSISYLDWSEKINARIAEQTGEKLAEWLPILEAAENSQQLPLVKVAAQRRSITIKQHRLSKLDTARLVERAPACYHQSAEELVLAATYLALARTFNLQRLCIDVEWHGRDEEFAGPQGLDRTVGWFTSVHPLCLNVPTELNLGNWLIALKETRAAIPERGRNFYALRYLSDDSAVREHFDRYRSPQVLFNFSGVVQRSHESWRSVPMAAIELGEGNANPYAMSVESEIRDGELIVSLYLDPAAWQDGRVERFGRGLIEGLLEIVGHCTLETNYRWTPSDFPSVSLKQNQVDELPLAAKTIYPLTDMQQTMYRHKDTYQVHMCYRMPRELNEPLWRQAVTDWIARHDCLRTCIKEWSDGQIHQLVLAEVTAPIGIHHAPSGEAAAFAEKLIESARTKPIQLTSAPLFDLQAISDGEDSLLVVLSIHHIIHDGWSIELLLNDLLQSYRHHLGEGVRKPTTPLASMADIVAQQRRLLADDTWRSYWANLPWERTSSQLPQFTPSHGQGVGQPHTADTRLYIGHIDQKLASDVRVKAGELGITTNSLWLAGYACFLRYLGGQTQVRCGVIQTGRMEEIPGFETITGCCANTLPLVLNIDDSSAVSNILTSVNEQLNNMRASAAFPLSHIHDGVKSKLDDELFCTLFNIESHRYGEHQDQLRPVLESGFESTNYRFIFGLIEQGNVKAEEETTAAIPHYGVRIGYDNNLFDEATVVMWLEIYAHCVRQLIDHTDAVWNELRLLPPSLRQQLVFEWNQTDHAFSSDRCMHTLFSEQAARTPHAEALVYENQRLSYIELDERSNRLAHHLRTLGVGPDVVVGLCTERSIHMIVGLLGILKAGGAYVPLDPELPPNRLAGMIKDIGLNLVLTQAQFTASSLAQVDTSVKIWRLDNDGEQTASYPSTAPETTVTPSNLIYVIFTSGSTGKPKAAMNQHGAVINYIQCLQARHQLDATDRVLQKTPLSFDVSAREIFWPLTVGSTLVMSRPGGHRDPAYMRDAIREHGITTLSFVPSMLQVFVDDGDLPSCTTLRRIFVSGEALPGALAARFLAASKAGLFNLYGPTEAAVDVSSHEVTTSDGAIVSIGRPIWNTRLYVLDSRLEPVPIGVTGELYIGGVAVGRGYLGRDELTSERFISSPFKAGERLYRTGDLAHWRADGEVEYLGRMDHQVKIRGFRIELGEIEHALSAHDSIKHAVVIARGDGERKKLVSYLVAKDLKWKDEQVKSQLMESLKNKLQAELPEYMVPAAFVFLEEIPCNANGKVDRAALPEPGPSDYLRVSHVEPGNEQERILWQIWRDVLRTDAFGVTDNFFSIGGDSILAIQVVSRAVMQGIALTPRLVTEEGTIRNLATKLTNKLADKLAGKNNKSIATKPAAGMPSVSAIKGEQRLLPIQLGFLQDDRVDVNRYCQYAVVNLPSHLDLALLKTILSEIVARHDVLRLKFRETSAGWVAQYRQELLSADAGFFDEQVIEIDTQDSANGFNGIEAEIERAQRSLDIKQGKLYRWVLLRNGQHAQLIWVMHHLVVDVVSWHVLQGDLELALAQAARGEQVNVTARTTSVTSYQEWAARLHEYAYSPSLEEEKTYWLEQLKSPALLLRYDHGSASESSDDIDLPIQETTEIVTISLNPEETTLLQSKASNVFDVPMNQLLIAALVRTLGDWLDVDDVRIDLESHGRIDMAGVPGFENIDISETVGWFTALYPVLITGVRGELVECVHETKQQLDAVPYNGIGYGVLSRLSHDEDIEEAKERIGGRTSDVLFNYIGKLNPETQGGSTISPNRTRTHAFGINGMIRDDALTFRIDYSRKQFKRETVDSVAARLVGVLRKMIACNNGGPGPRGKKSPFPLAEIEAGKLAALQEKFPALQDLYPATGMQQGLLLLADRSPQTGLYLTQLRIQMEAVDPVRLRRSWLELTKRNPVLRTAFIDAGQDFLLQMVMAEVDLPWREIDLRESGSTEEKQQQLEKLLGEERTKPFEQHAAPLMRLLLVRVSDSQYWLAWTHHHALIDGWSMGLLIKELFELYLAPQSPAPVAPAYKNYIAWLRAQDNAAAQRYWRGYFDGLPIAASGSLPLTSESLGNTADQKKSLDGQKAHTIQLSPETTAQLRRLVQTEGVGLGTMILAAWGLLQSKYNGEQEVLFGYATSGRPAALDGIENMVGLFINSLPIRLKIDAKQSLSNWMKAIQRIQLDHDDHGFLPLSDIQRCSGIRHDQTLFNALVVVENFPLDRSLLSMNSGDGLRLLDVQGVEQSDVGLNLIVYPGERLTLKLAYQSAQFDATTTLLLLRRLAQLLESFARGGTQLISQLSFLSEEEHRKAVFDWNATEASYPLDRPVPELFQIQADSRENQCAIVAGDERWTYRQLANRAQAISSWLRSNGVKPCDRVAISLKREPDLVASLLGIMQAGAAYVPMALDCPPERGAYIVRDAGINRLLTRHAYLEQAESWGVTPLFLEDCATDESATNVSLQDNTPTSQDSRTTAYVIYTSGTTGKPKGVLVSHRNLVNFCCWFGQTGLSKAGEGFSQFAPHTFDASAGEIFGALLNGAELHLLGDALIQDPRSLAEYFTEQGIRFAAFPPPYLQQIEPEWMPRDISLLTAGSAPTPELVQRWSQHCRYVNAYGPTETTILSSAWNGKGDRFDDKKLSIGHPISNTSIYVVDSVGQLCAPGLLGEIWIGGEGVASGYLNRPDLNEENFLADPWRAGGRVYRTGDLGRWLDDGRIECVGRKDSQVKLRGFRIELNEIQNRIREHAEVQDAAVLVRGEDADKRLLAWVVRHGEANSSLNDVEFISTLRDFLRRSLPEYMLPQSIVLLDQLPLTANGKVDDKALVVPDIAINSDRIYVAPRTETESALVEIWAAVLKLPSEQISATANFFELGGHSLLAMRAISRLREQLGIDIGVVDLLANPILADLATLVDSSASHRLPPVSRADRNDQLPLSLAQQRLWFLSQMPGVSKTYHVPGVLRLQGSLDKSALRRALDRIVARHEVLRTRFEMADGEPIQRIVPDQGFTLIEHDLSRASDATEQLSKIIEEEFDTQFDLATSPLIRGRLIALSADENILLITQHHIVTDAWSLALLVRELSTIYNAYRVNEEDPLPTLAVQYADYAVWQRQWLSDEWLQTQTDFWRNNLLGAPALLELPTDKPRPAQQKYDGDIVDFTLNAETTEALKALSRRHDTTLFVTLLTGWAIVLSRLSGHQDVVIGSPVANRMQAELEPIIGFFVNTLALRIDLSGEPTVAELLERVRQQTLNAQRHQQTPFEHVVEVTQPLRSLAHSPIFQVMFNWQSENVANSIALDGLQITSGAASNRTQTQAKFDLTLDLGEVDGTIVGGIEFATALFERETIVRWTGYLERVFHEMLNERQDVRRMNILGEDEKRLLMSFNNTYQPDLIEHTWPELFAEQVIRTPERVAVQCESAQLTYAELDERTSRIATALREQGVQAGQIVALLDKRSTDLLVMIIAVLKTGAVYLPIDPTHPQQRWLDILNEAQPSSLVVGNALIEERRWLEANWLPDRIRSAGELLSAATSSLNLPYPKPDDLAYLLFTSGSTGKPKGVMIEHRGMINNMRSKFAPLSMTADDVIAQTAPQCFDISVWQFLSGLLLGAKVYVVANEITRDPEALLQCLDHYRVTIWEPVPSLIQATLPYARPMPHLRWVISVGEALPRELVDRWFEQYPTLPLMNHYGPAECSDDVTFHPIHAPVERVLVGVPLPNAQMHLVDDQLQLVPLGVVGEIAVSGAVVGRGYINRADETKARFRQNPYATHATEQRLYLTGDLARRLPSGEVEYIGRKDFQVKIRGFRIELGEIESCLASHASVREAVVIASESGHGNKQLVAYVTLKAGLESASTTDELRTHLSAVLPDYMIPATIVLLDALPLNANSKVDRKALLALEVKSETTSFIAPNSGVESTLASIWQDLLGIDRVSRNDNFFDLGGHSLLAARLVGRLRHELNIEVNIADLFASPVLGDFARVLGSSVTADKPAITASARNGTLPLSFAQQRLWFLSQMQGGSESYHMPGILHLHGVLDRQALRGALDQIVARHEVLRTRFVLISGEPHQNIGAVDQGFSLIEHDLNGNTDTNALQTLISEAIRAPFDLAVDAPVRGCLFTLSEDRHILLITQHHIASDAWSQGVLIRELSELYNAYHNDVADSLPALLVQYADYAVWQRQHLTGAWLGEQINYWRRTLADAPALLELPTDRPRPAQQVFDGDYVSFELGEEITASLKDMSRTHGTTMFMTLLAAWSVVLNRLSGQTDLVIGSPTANRVQAEVEPLIGFFVNMLALRIDLSSEPTVAELLARVKQQTLNAQRHQQIPFEQVVDVIQPPRSLAHTPIFQVMFNWLTEDPAGAINMDGLRVESQNVTYRPSKFDLSLDLVELNGNVKGGVEYAIALFDRVTIERWIGYFKRVLHAMIQNQQQKVQQLDLLGPEEVRWLSGFNDTYRAELIDRSWPDLFAEQALRTPDRIAVQCAAKQLTYRELHELTSKLALVLRARCIEEGRAVAVLNQRGTDMLVAIIAIMKAGGAYLPLDPAHPSQRWIEILEESHANLLIVGDSLIEQHAWLAGNWSRDKVSLHTELVKAAPTKPATNLLFPQPNDLAYLLFTSGSTGKPKGVMIEHRGMINNIRAKHELLVMTEDDVIAHTAPQCFDISMWQFLSGLLLGAKVYIVDSDITRDPEALLACLNQQAITIWEPVPSLIQAVLQVARPLPHMRWVISVGEALPRELVERWFKHYPNLPLMNHYGPAECSDGVTFHPIHSPVARVLIGTPIANAQMHLVDDHLQLVPLGAVGEIAVAGSVVGRGYVNRLDETQKKFRINPYSLKDIEQRLYLTGDLGRRLPDGNVEYVGRKDFQVKIRGFRIELGEIESTLTTHPEVREAVLMARELGQNNTQLVAYVTLKNPVAVDNLKVHLRLSLPDYMIPAAIMALDRLPLNANGKVDRKALPAPSIDAFQQSAYEEPENSTERTIAATWQELLNVPRVGRGDNFFDLGGSSLSLVRMLGRLRDQGLSLSVTDVYQQRTLKALSEVTSLSGSSISNWLASRNWQFKNSSVVHKEKKVSVLLVEQIEQSKIVEFKHALNMMECSDIPDFIRVCNDQEEKGLEALMSRMHNQGFSALGLECKDIAHSYESQLVRYLEALATAPRQSEYAFSTMQRGMREWEERDSFAMIEITGWYATQELQDAFAYLSSEQDMLRAIPDHDQQRWDLLNQEIMASIAIPHIELKYVESEALNGHLVALHKNLQQARKRTPLAYTASWASVTDTKHFLLLSLDHMIWDGVSQSTMQRRLHEVLTGKVKPITRTYRDYLGNLQRRCDKTARDIADSILNRGELITVMSATRNALDARRDQALQIASFNVPLAMPEKGAEQAFALFKRWIIQVTGLSQVGTVLIHHGRELGGHRYFDQVGLFLDKIPCAIEENTPLSALSVQAASLHERGIHYASLEEATNLERARILPDLSREILFNFQTESPSPLQQGLTNEMHLRDKLKSYFGLLFEAHVAEGELRIYFAFRGNEAEIDELKQAFTDACDIDVNLH